MPRTWAARSRGLRWRCSPDRALLPNSRQRSRRSDGRTGRRRRAGRPRRGTSRPRRERTAGPIRRARIRPCGPHPARRGPASLRRERRSWWSSVSWLLVPSRWVLSVCGPERSQPVATGGKCDDAGNAEIKPKPLPWVAASCRPERMVRGLRFEFGKGLPAKAPRAWRPEPSADPLRQLDDDPLRAADVAQPIDVFVVLHLANELPAVGSHAGDGGVDVVDCECDMADARGVRRRVLAAARARRGVKLHQLEPSVAVRGLHHRDLRPDALETHDAVHPSALDRPLALQLESELDEERLRGREVVEDDAHMVHTLDRHALDGSADARSTTAYSSKRNSDHAGRQRSLS